MSIYDFDDELPEDEEQESTKKAAAPAKKKGKQVMNTQVNLSPRDASRLNGMHVEAIATLDDVSLPKNRHLQGWPDRPGRTGSQQARRYHRPRDCRIRPLSVPEGK